MIWTGHKHEIVTVINKKKQEKLKPVEIRDYNSNMSGGDRADQLMLYCSIPRKTIKWYHKITFI